jgi:hypothetical protein
MSNQNTDLSTDTIIDGYTASVDDGNVYVQKGSFSASLSALEYSGCLENGDQTMRIPRVTINKIVEWSAANGGPADVG